jgi:hypothetical protein
MVPAVRSLRAEGGRLLSRQDGFMTQTPRLGHAPIKMHLVEPYARNGPDGRARPGDFFWEIEDGKRLLVVALPCKGGNYGLWCEWSIDHKNHCNASWSWNGNETAPTLKPSLHWKGAWHGYVRNGELLEA